MRIYTLDSNTHYKKNNETLYRIYMGLHGAGMEKWRTLKVNSLHVLETRMWTHVKSMNSPFQVSNGDREVCPGSSDPFYIVSYYNGRVTTSWTYYM